MVLLLLLVIDILIMLPGRVFKLIDGLTTGTATFGAEIGKSIQVGVQLIPTIDFKPIRGLVVPLIG